MRRSVVKWMSAPLLASLCISAVPAQAGLFDFFFQSAAPRPAYEPQPGYGELPFGEIPPPRRRFSSHPHPRITVTNREGSDLSLPGGIHAEDLMNDHTLREGDAVMTDKGLRIFAGASHGEKEFAKLNDAKGLPVFEQQQLAEINVQRSEEADQPQDKAKSDSGKPLSSTDGKLVSGRSSAMDTQAWKWVRDPKGVLVRYVGP